MRGPIRMRISWLDANTLKVDTDYGMQTRLLRFANAGTQLGPRSWQGATAAEWIVHDGARGSQKFGTLKTVTTNLRSGYLRKNGVPYSERAVFTEYWDVHTLPNGDKLLVDTNVVDDPTTSSCRSRRRFTTSSNATPVSGIPRPAMRDSDVNGFEWSIR
jgi:hypothetical protein